MESNTKAGWRFGRVISGSERHLEATLTLRPIQKLSIFRGITNRCDTKKNYHCGDYLKRSPEVGRQYGRKESRTIRF